MKILSLGAGVQSTAMLLMSDRGEIDRADCAIFADVGAEPKNVYDWLDYLESKVSIPIYRVSKGNLYEDIVNGGRFASIPFFTLDEQNKTGMVRRQCTNEYKIQPIQKKARELAGYKARQRIPENTVIMMIGISLDETYRMKSSSEKWIKNTWPLIQKRMSRGDCIKYVENVLGKTPPRSSCLFCPFHNDKEWLAVKNGPKDEWEKVIAVEKQLQKLERFKNTAFLHRDCKPIEQVDFYDGSDQLDMFGNECEGMCGV